MILRFAGDDREVERDLRHALGRRPALFRLYEEGERLPLGIRAFAERLDGESGCEQAVDDLLEVVAPVVVRRVGDLARRPFDVALVAFVVDAARAAEVVLGDGERFVAERVEERVVVAQEGHAARNQHLGDRVRPIAQVGKPGDRARSRHHDVEGPFDDVRGEPRVALHEGRVGAGTLRDAPCVRKRGGGEVEPPCLACAEAQPRDRVGADVALQVEDGKPGEACLREVGQERLEVAPRDAGDVARIGDEPFDLVKRRFRVNGGAVVPVVAVLRELAVEHVVGCYCAVGCSSVRACIGGGMGEVHGGRREHFADGLQARVEALVARQAFLISEDADDAGCHERSDRPHVLPREVEAELARPRLRESPFETFGEAGRSVRSRQQADALHGASLIAIKVE